MSFSSLELLPTDGPCATYRTFLSLLRPCRAGRVFGQAEHNAGTEPERARRPHRAERHRGWALRPPGVLPKDVGRVLGRANWGGAGAGCVRHSCWSRRIARRGGGPRGEQVFRAM